MDALRAYLVALTFRCMGHGCERTVFRIFLCSLIKWFTSRKFDNLCDESWKLRRLKIEYWAAERLQRTCTNGYHHVSSVLIPCQLQVTLPRHEVRLAEAWYHSKALPSYAFVLFIRLKLITVITWEGNKAHTPTYYMVAWYKTIGILRIFITRVLGVDRARWYNIAPGLAQWLHWKRTHWPLLEKVLRDCLLDYRGDLVSINVVTV